MPSLRPPEVIRVRYDRLRMLAARIQTVLGDIATQGEGLQALVSWRDPRATRLFIGACLMVVVVLYVVPPKMVAMMLGFYFLRHPMFRDPMPPKSLKQQAIPLLLALPRLEKQDSRHHDPQIPPRPSEAAEAIAVLRKEGDWAEGRSPSSGSGNRE